MNKKMVIPIGLCLIVIAIGLSTCPGNDKIHVEWTPVPAAGAPADSFTLKVYVENSGSMNGYMCAGSNLKDAVFDYVSDLNRFAASCSLHYINSQVIPYDGGLHSFIKDLTPQSFAQAGGNTKNTDLMQIFDTILGRQGPADVSLFVSDCILDLPGNASDFLGQCQVSIKNSFHDAISRNPGLGVEIVKLESKFDGWWFCGPNKERLRDVKRPYYIWIIGDQRYLSELNKKAPVGNVIGGIEAYSAYSAARPIPFDIRRRTYIVNRGKITVELLADLGGSLQEGDVLRNTARYRTADPSQAAVVSVKEIADPASPYSHVIELDIANPKSAGAEAVAFSYPYLAAWVAESNDTTGHDVMEHLDKTTGLMSLVKGVAEAFKNDTVYGTIPFKLTNN